MKQILRDIVDGIGDAFMEALKRKGELLVLFGSLLSAFLCLVIGRVIGTAAGMPDEFGVAGFSIGGLFGLFVCSSRFRKE